MKMGLLGIIRAGSQFHIAILTVFKRALDVDVDGQVWRTGVIEAGHSCDGVSGLLVRVVDEKIMDSEVSLAVEVGLFRPGELVIAPTVDVDFLPLQAVPLQTDQDPELGLWPEHEPAVFGFRRDEQVDAEPPSEQDKQYRNRQYPFLHDTDSALGLTQHSPLSVDAWQKLDIKPF